MNRSTCVVVLAAVIVTCIFSASGQPPDKSTKGFLSALKKGQPINVKEVAGRFEITVMEGMQGVMTHKVISVEDDCVVFEDAAKLILTRIPVFSIKAITTLRQAKD